MLNNSTGTNSDEFLFLRQNGGRTPHSRTYADCHRILPPRRHGSRIVRNTAQQQQEFLNAAALCEAATAAREAFIVRSSPVPKAKLGADKKSHNTTQHTHKHNREGLHPLIDLLKSSSSGYRHCRTYRQSEIGYTAQRGCPESRNGKRSLPPTPT